jgi:beta-phosphoglucomutase-like phosphatase (HAD superfamily)
MTGGEILRFAPIDAAAIEVLLCDADGNLFGSEEPAFVASAEVTNRFLAELGSDRRLSADGLRRQAIGRNFRSTALDLAAELGATVDDRALERWVAAERDAVVEHLSGELRPDPEVSEPLTELAHRYRLAVVSSSAHARLDACFRATDLHDLFPPGLRFSAEDSLPVPTSKPDPAIYAFAGRQLGVSGAAGLAVEDAVSGARSAVAAGFPTVGNLQFVADDERDDRVDALRDAGVAAIVPSWRHLALLLGCDVPLRTPA